MKEGRRLELLGLLEYWCFSRSLLLMIEVFERRT